MTWYSCRYDNKRTLNIMIEVAFDDPDNTSLFLSSSDIQLLSVKLIRRRCCRFDQFFLFHFFYFFFIYIYIIFLFSPYDHGGTYHCIDFITYIGECAKDTHNCSRDNATCTNTEGFFNCSCDPGFSGDEHNCARVRIFQSMIAFSFQQVKHTWPDLFVHKYF